MPEMTIRDRDGDVLTIAPAGGGGYGIHLKTSVPWGLEFSPKEIRELGESLIRMAAGREVLAYPGEVWESKEYPGRTVEVLEATNREVTYKVLTDAAESVAKGRRSTVGHIRKVSAQTWRGLGAKNGYRKIKEVPGE